ncbi:ciliogenesis and planar polarity effector 1 isoform X4 [Hyperolius riggenbachi]|uniref:ciliogenesis and planar polarity effector 1 isoform X4 n=1 Tax=Hyperolius riggenbachi TaxID=752182 RepID=UPI0035A3374A
MEVSLEVLLSTGIKRKQPCLRLCWLGQEKEAVFLVDEKRVSEVSLRSGNVKKTLLKKSSVVALATSATGAWLAALNVSGELSLWKKDLDCLLTVPAVPEISQVIAVAQETSLKLYLFVSGDGSRVLLATHTGCVYMWESAEEKTRLTSQKNRLLTGRWTKVDPQDALPFPDTADKEATMNAIFLKNEVIGDCCLCTFVFYSGTRLMMTFLSLRWIEGEQKYNSVSPYHVHWAQQDCSLDTFHPTCEPVKSRGALVAAFSKDGLLLALAVNQKDPKATCVIFVNTMNFVTVYGNLRGCGSRNQQIPSRYLRSYWVGDMAWTADSLFLVCMLKRGSLLLLTRLGELLTLTTSGCSVEFGPAEFIPLHPLITYRPPVSILDNHNPNDSLGSVTSEADLMRQRFSVTCHPRLPYLIVSDGYMVTALRFTQNMSPYYFMKALLLDAAQRLENVRQSLQLGKPKRNGFKLRSLASLKATLLKDGEKAPSSVMSTVPSFLQDEEELCGHLERLLQDDDDEDCDDQEYLKYIAPSDSAIGKADQGRLEFASMFDTIHASDHSMGKRDLLSELQNIRRTLLTAWTTGVTMRNTAETNTLLHYTVGCLTHFLSLFQSPKCPRLKSDKHYKNSGKGSTLWATYIAILYQCLAALHWDVSPQQAIGHMIKLTSEAVKLILVQHSQLYSKSLVESFCLLKTVSQSLSAIYLLHFESMPTAVGGSTNLDVVKTPVFEAPLQATKRSLVHYVFKELPNAVAYRENSEKRLAVLWRLVYNQTLWYQTRLRKQISGNQSMLLSLEVQSEERAIVSLLCHLQAELQSTGQHLKRELRLLPVTGEEFFLFGSYRECIEFWRSELVEATAQSGRRVGLLQTRHYLAILYCHLYNYNLNDAQGLCDQLVKELLVRSSLLAEAEQEAHAGVESEHRLLGQVLPEAALTVIQSMGRFMAAYFTNQLLYVFPPHKVCVLAPLHVSTDKFPRVITLQHSTVASAVRDQNLSRVWTVEYALDLLLIGGLIPEAAWLANQLGDWKMSVSMAVAYNLHLQSIPDESNGDVPSMPLSLSPAHIFKEKLQSFLGQPPSVNTPDKKLSETKHFTDPIEEEDADVLFTSVQEMLKAAVMADAEILTESLHQLIESAKELIGKLSGLVPERLYLPAPPLYCPQPSSVSEEDPGDLLLNQEKLNRQKLSGVLQRILLLLRAAHCSLPAAQWYIKQIKRTRKVMQKIRAKGSLPPLGLLPESLLNYANSKTVFLKPGASGDHASGDLVSCSVLSCFRELCALCWMLHVREKLSLSCRLYQKARDNGKVFKSSDEYDPCVTERCFEALDWACRMLPFTRVTNCEELVQDIILSLISELPPVKKVAEIMVKAFPHPDEVRVPLREKYHSVQQRLRHAMIKGLDREERMSLVIHSTQKVRVKALRRIQRNIGPVEMHLWEPALDENPETHYYDKYSLGTSLSRSTLTDLGRLYSDTDTLSDTLLSSTTEDRMEWNVPFSSRPRFAGKLSKAKRDKMSDRGEMPTETAAALPKVGTWEFECDDEEYSNFLDLFLSYLLEKDLIHNAEPGVPFLTAFSQHLREHELNSLAFDVHTTLKRKLGRAEIKSVFRAGSCYRVTADQQNDSTLDSTAIQPPGTSEPPPVSCSTVVLGKPVPSAGRYFRKNPALTSARSGLFGLQDPRTQKSSDDDCNVSSSVYTRDQYSYRLVQSKQCTPSEELGIELQTKYSNEIKLVEWMIRWSDRRLFWTSGKAELCHVAPNTAIRVKTSSAAILTSMWLLEKPYLVPPRQYIVAPVIRSAVKPSLHREASVDDDQSELGRGALSTVHEEDSELLQGSDSRASSKISRISINSPERQYEGYEDKSVDEEYAEFKANAVKHILVPSETEDEQDDQLDTQRSPKISVSIQPIAAQIQNVSPDAEHSAEDPEDTYVEEIEEESNEPAVYPDSPAHRHSVDTSKPPTPPTSHAHLPASASNGGENTQPAIASDAVRQLFQDEMFRLLQLQQINFMSLMQVVGSSFAALPAIQHIMQQTAQLSGNSMTGQAPPPLQMTIPAPQGSANPSLQTPPPHQRPDLAQASNLWTGAAPVTAPNPDTTNLQRLPEITIPPNQSTDGGRIPSNLGLLSAAPGQTPLPLITPSVSQPKIPNLNPPPVSSNISGLPLLKLHTSPTLMPLNLLAGTQTEHHSRAKERPLPREAWGQSTPLIMPTSHGTQPPSYIGLSRASISNAEEATRWAEPVVKGRSRHSAGHMSKLGDHTQQPFLRLEEKKHKAQTSLLRVPLNNAGMPLLRLHAEPSLLLPAMPLPNFPVSLAPPNGGKTDGHLMEGRPASFTLLKVNFPQAIQSLEISPAPRLIPLQNLIAYERDVAQRGQPAEGSMQLLKANIQPFEEVVTPGDSIKRQKRRIQQEKGEKKEKKSSVTFRPEESIIIPNNFDEVERAEKELNDEPNLKESNEFVIPPGSFESALSDPIPAPLLPTMAELHYLASLTKNPPEVQDASTSTGPASRSVTDVGTVCDAIPANVVAASASPPALREPHKPLMEERAERGDFVSRRMAASHPAAEAGLPLHRPPELFLNLPYDEQQKTSSVHRVCSPLIYSEDGPLTLTDLDGGEFPMEALDVEENLPSAADLHIMAAARSVQPPQLYHDPENFSLDVLQSPPRLEDRMAGGDGGFTLRARSMGVTPASSREPELRAWTPRAREHHDALSRLKEMDAQLRALQNMADSMEKDFANTDLLVNTIENLTSVVDPELKEIRPSRGPAAPRSELPLSNGILEELVEEEEFSLPSPEDIRPQERPLQVFISSKRDFRPKTDPGQDRGTENRTVNEPLQMTGLSDFADILGDLMAGGVSASELGLTTAQAEALSRQRPHLTSKRSQKERAELRMWMKKKQRERLAEHRRQLEELRGREHNRFQPKHNANTLGSSKTIQQSQRTKGEKDRLLLSQHHMHRVSDAMNLMQEMLSDQVPAASAKPSRPQTSTSRYQGAQAASRGSHTVGRSRSAGHAGKSRSPTRPGILQPRSSSAASRTQIRGTATFVLPKSNSGGRARSAPSYSVTRRYDPALPGDRMSQITRRGILAGKNRTNLTGIRPILKPTSKPLTPFPQDKRSKATSPQSPMQEEHDRDVLSPWELPDDINRILNRSRNSITSQGSLFNGDTPHYSQQDNVSDSTGSILSTLDWTAIDDMVASVGNT